jgi:hypothetical protein
MTIPAYSPFSPILPRDENALPVPKDAPDLGKLYPIFCNSVTETVVETMPTGEILEVMYQNGVIDPEQEAIIRVCRSKGVTVEAAKVGDWYYGQRRQGIYVNKLVHVSFTSEPALTTLKPCGIRKPMEYFDLLALSDAELISLSEKRELHLSLPQMKRLAAIQEELCASR